LRLARSARSGSVSSVTSRPWSRPRSSQMPL